MADLITHSCVALLWKVASTPGRPPSERWRLPGGVATFLLGTCLPDLLGRVPSMALTTLRWQFPAIPEWAVYLWSPFHVPLGILLGSVLVAQVFTARREAAWQLAWGGLLHVAVDLLQTHLGIGYLLLFPFSMWDFELGWIGSEATVLIVPVLLPLTVLACWARWWRGLNRRQPG